MPNTSANAPMISHAVCVPRSTPFSSAHNRAHIGVESQKETTTEKCQAFPPNKKQINQVSL